MKACYESIYLPLCLKKLLIKRCILIDFSHSDQRWQKTQEMAAKHMKTREFSLRSRRLVRMNFCVIFLICNSGHCLIRVIIKHNTMLHSNILCLFNCLLIYLLLVSFFLLQKKNNFIFPEKKKKWLRQVQVSITSLFWKLEDTAWGI